MPSVRPGSPQILSQRLTRLVTGSCQGSTRWYSNLKVKPGKPRVPPVAWGVVLDDTAWEVHQVGTWKPEDSRNTQKRPNTSAKVGAVGLRQCSHDLQPHLGLLLLPISPHLAPCTSSCQVVCQLILIQPSVLARFREKREIAPSGSAEKSHGAECHQHTDSTAAKPQLPHERSAGAVTERVWWDVPLSLQTREKLS